MTIQTGYRKQKTVSASTLAAVGFLAGVGLFLAWYVRLEPLFSWLNPAVTTIKNGVATLSSPVIGLFQGLANGFMANPIPYVTAGISIASVTLLPLVKRHYEQQKQKAEAQAAQQVISMQGQMLQQQQILGQTQTKAQNLEQQVALLQNSDLSNSLGEAQNLLAQRNEEVRSLRSQNETLMRVIEDLKTKTFTKVEVR